MPEGVPYIILTYNDLFFFEQTTFFYIFAELNNVYVAKNCGRISRDGVMKRGFGIQNYKFRAEKIKKTCDIWREKTF